MEKESLKKIILEQKQIFEKDMDIVKRDISKNIIKSPKIVVITGVRRCGKSTLLRQISSDFSDYAYLNFEDERFLDFSYQDFNMLLEVFIELYPRLKTIFFDEIQNISGWEKFVRRLFAEGYKIFITGSNANLLSSEIATTLTGRNLKVELSPFSFKEYLTYLDFQIKDIYTSKEIAKISSYLNEYIRYGGFPEAILSKDYEELSELYQDILIKDLLVRAKIRDTKDFRELALYLISNISKKISFNKIKNLLQFSNTSKVKNYVDLMSEAYLFFTINKYDPSIKKQIINDRKIYSIDHGMVNAVSFRFSENKGRLFENIVYLELRRRYNDIYYMDEEKECDFLIKEGQKITLAFQASVELSDRETLDRELEGAKKAVERFKLKKAYIITLDKEEKIGNIEIIPLWKWLIS